MMRPSTRTGLPLAPLGTPPTWSMRGPPARPRRTPGTPWAAAGPFPKSCTGNSSISGLRKTVNPVAVRPTRDLGSRDRGVRDPGVRDPGLPDRRFRSSSGMPASARPWASRPGTTAVAASLGSAPICRTLRRDRTFAWRVSGSPELDSPFLLDRPFVGNPGPTGRPGSGVTSRWDTAGGIAPGQTAPGRTDPWWTALCWAVPGWDRSVTTRPRRGRR